MEKHSRIYIAGHETIAGAAIVYQLRQVGYTNLVYHTKEQLDLTDHAQVEHFFANEDIDYVFLAAEIPNNTEKPIEVLQGNLAIQMNVISNAYRYGVFNLIFVCDRTIYPAVAPEPLREEYLLSSYLEQTYEPYAIAKLAGIKLCQAYNKQYGTNYISVIPATIYEQGSMELTDKSTLATWMESIYFAKQNKIDRITIHLTRDEKQQFISSIDFANACIGLIQKQQPFDVINIGNEECMKSSEVVAYLMGLLDYRGEVIFSQQLKHPMHITKRLDTERLQALGIKIIDSMTTDMEMLLGSLEGINHNMLKK